MNSGLIILDNMAFRLEDKMQKQLNFAIVDEVDSILIDEARTPLIISGAAEDSSQLYLAVNKLIPNLKWVVKAGSLQNGDDGQEFCCGGVWALYRR